MAKKKYLFCFSYGQGLVEFDIDLEKFTPEVAQETLDFFLWDYDHEEDPISEVVKKYALRVFKMGSGYSAIGVIRHWDEEGFAKIDGSMGILLTEYEQLDVEDCIELEVSDV